MMAGMGSCEALREIKTVASRAGVIMVTVPAAPTAPTTCPWPACARVRLEGCHVRAASDEARQAACA